MRLQERVYAPGAIKHPLHVRVGCLTASGVGAQLRDSLTKISDKLIDFALSSGVVHAALSDRPLDAILKSYGALIDTRHDLSGLTIIRTIIARPLSLLRLRDGRQPGKRKHDA